VGPVHDGFGAIKELLAGFSAAAKKTNVVCEASASEVGARGVWQVDGKAKSGLGGEPVKVGVDAEEEDCVCVCVCV
jgi:hypothetical protein